MSIFDEQISRKPDLYPWTEQFIEAAQNNLWTHREFSFQTDVQDFKTKMTKEEQDMIIRALSCIGQLEISVKKFWSKLGDNLPHPSLYDLGYVFAYQEQVHSAAYERLLEVLGIEDAFDKVLEMPILQGRVNYLKKYLHKFHSDNKKQFVYSLVLFTIFVENVALFSQFYTCMWFKRYKNYLKDTEKQTEYSSREEDCFIEGTEILTPSGWVDFRNIKEGDSVYQYHEDGTITQTNVQKYHEKEFSGNLISFSDRSHQCIVTPTHDIIYYNGKNEFKKRQAQDIKIHKEFKIPRGGYLKSENKNRLTDEERLRIAIQADGSTAKWTSRSGETFLRGANGGFTHTISIKKDRKKENLRDILSKSGIKYSERNKSVKEGYSIFSIYYNHDENYKTLDWVDLSSVSKEWCEDFVEECVKWDGHISNEGQYSFSSSDKDAIDTIQAICILAGYRTHINVQTYEEENHRDNYRLYITKGNFLPIASATKKENVEYSGKVYCVTVPSGAIITRYQDKTFIAGNCHHNAGCKIINEIKKEFPELFDTALKERVIEESQNALEYEMKIIDWIIGDFDHEYLNRDLLKNFIKNRLNRSLTMIGYEPIFEIDKEILEKTNWFEEQIKANNQQDFFDNRATEYVKNSQSFDEDSLF